MQELKGKQKRHLRALAHALQPVVLIGQRGLSEAVVRQIDGALGDHELIKVKLSKECPIERDEAGEEVSARTGSVVAGAVGRVLILYRPHPEKPRIQLPGQA